MYHVHVALSALVGAEKWGC